MSELISLLMINYEYKKFQNRKRGFARQLMEILVIHRYRKQKFKHNGIVI